MAALQMGGASTRSDYALLLAIIPSLPRPVLTRLTTRMIDHLDVMDGDSDIEANGDELDGSMGEDDFHPQSANWLGHPGCPISDPGGCEHDGREPDDEWVHSGFCD